MRSKKPTAKERADSRWRGKPMTFPAISELSTKSEMANALSKHVDELKARVRAKASPDVRQLTKLDALGKRLKRVDAPSSRKTKQPK